MLVHTWAAVQTKHVISLVLETVATSHWFTLPVCLFLSSAPSPLHDFSFLLLYQNTKQKPFEEERVFSSLFENAVHHGRQSMVPDAWGSSSHCSCTGEQRKMDAGTQFAFFFSVSLAPQSIEWYHPHSRCGFLSSTQSGNPLPDLLTGLFRQFQTLSRWKY